MGQSSATRRFRTMEEKLEAELARSTSPTESTPSEQESEPATTKKGTKK